jgi:hypothetical protein
MKRSCQSEVVLNDYKEPVSQIKSVGRLKDWGSAPFTDGVFFYYMARPVLGLTWLPIQANGGTFPKHKMGGV